MLPPAPRVERTQIRPRSPRCCPRHICTSHDRQILSEDECAVAVFAGAGRGEPVAGVVEHSVEGQGVGGMPGGRKFVRFHSLAIRHSRREDPAELAPGWPMGKSNRMRPSETKSPSLITSPHSSNTSRTAAWCDDSSASSLPPGATSLPRPKPIFFSPSNTSCWPPSASRVR